MTGQDVLTGGFTGALFGGFLCASSILGLKTLINFDSYTAKIKKGEELNVVERKKFNTIS
jgi:hypothetical protein